MDIPYETKETLNPNYALFEADRWVTAIQDRAGDYEVAHSMEDSLHRAALKVIAAGYDEPRKLAKIVLKTRRIEFSRWYA